MVLALLASIIVLVPTPSFAAEHEMRVDSVDAELSPVDGSETPGAFLGAATVELEPSEGGLGASGAPLRPVGEQRRSTVTDVDEFVAIGVELPEVADDHTLMLRVVEYGSWGAWIPLVVHTDHGPDPEGNGPRRNTSEPVWVGSGSGWELYAPAEAGAVRVHLVREDSTRVLVDDTARAGAQPTIRSRSSWAARSPKATPAIASELQFAVVHHSGSSSHNGYTAEEVPSIIRAIQAFHMDANGWNDIAYNFVVDQFGRTWEARAGGVREAVVGGHALGFNTASMGVVVLGEFGAINPSGAAVNAVADLIGWKFLVHGIDPRGTTRVTSGGSPTIPEGSRVTLRTIVGHRDVGATGCPGSNLYARLGDIRGRAGSSVFDAGLGNGTFSAASRSVGTGERAPIVGDFNGDERADVLWERSGSNDAICWAEATGASTRSRSRPIRTAVFHWSATTTGTDGTTSSGTGLARRGTRCGSGAVTAPSRRARCRSGAPTNRLSDASTRTAAGTSCGTPRVAQRTTCGWPARETPSRLGPSGSAVPTSRSCWTTTAIVRTTSSGTGRDRSPTTSGPRPTTGGSPAADS